MLRRTLQLASRSHSRVAWHEPHGATCTAPCPAGGPPAALAALCPPVGHPRDAGEQHWTVVLRASMELSCRAMLARGSKSDCSAGVITRLPFCVLAVGGTGRRGLTVSSTCVHIERDGTRQQYCACMGAGSGLCPACVDLENRHPVIHRYGATRLCYIPTDRCTSRHALRGVPARSRTLLVQQPHPRRPGISARTAGKSEPAPRGRGQHLYSSCSLLTPNLGPRVSGAGNDIAFLGWVHPPLQPTHPTTFYSFCTWAACAIRVPAPRLPSTGATSSDDNPL